MRCIYSKNNKKCGAYAMKNDSYCYYHNPSIPKTIKKDAQSRGGKANKPSIKEPKARVDLRDIKSLVLLIEDTINEVREGKLDIRIANSIGFLTSLQLKLVEVFLQGDKETRSNEEFEKRLAENIVQAHLNRIKTEKKMREMEKDGLLDRANRN